MTQWQTTQMIWQSQLKANFQIGRMCLVWSTQWYTTSLCFGCTFVFFVVYTGFDNYYVANDRKDVDVIKNHMNHDCNCKTSHKHFIELGSHFAHQYIIIVILLYGYFSVVTVRESQFWKKLIAWLHTLQNILYLMVQHGLKK